MSLALQSPMRVIVSVLICALIAGASFGHGGTYTTARFGGPACGPPRTVAITAASEDARREAAADLTWDHWWELNQDRHLAGAVAARAMRRWQNGLRDEVLAALRTGLDDPYFDTRAA